MIFQAQVNFFLREAALQVPGQKQVPLNIEQKLLVSPTHDKLIFITPPSTAVCRVYLAPCKVIQISPTECRLVHEKRVRGKGHAHHLETTQVLSIKSTQQCINWIKQKVPARRYKSCLSFSPSQVRHVSILSGESTSQRYRGFINLIVIMFIVLNMRNIYVNFKKYGARFLDYPLEFLPWSATIGFGFIFVFVELAFRLDRLRFHRLLSDTVVRILLKVNQVSLLIFLSVYCRKFLLLRPISGIGLTAFGMVFFLKLVSYMHVNTEIFALLKRSSALAQSEFNEFVFANHEINNENLKLIVENRKNWPFLLTRTRLYYFLLAPTLCYQLEYPKSPSRRYSWLFKRLIELMVISALIGVLWLQYIEPQLHHWLSQEKELESNRAEAFYRLLRLSIPNTMGWILGFYALFHLFLNIMAELIRFGDRNFYDDWWNCRNLQQYWKTWNLPVHFFFIRHVYTPLLKRGWSKVGANVLVFFTSAVAHEYLVNVPLGVVSYFAFVGMMLQAPVIIIEKKLSKVLNLQDSELGNVSFWVFFCFLGQPTCLFIYYSLYMKANIGQFS